MADDNIIPFIPPTEFYRRRKEGQRADLPSRHGHGVPTDRDIDAFVRAVQSLAPDQRAAFVENLNRIAEARGLARRITAADLPESKS